MVIYLEMATSTHPVHIITVSAIISNIILSDLVERTAMSLSLCAKFMSVRFRASQIVRFISFESTELHIILIKRAVAGTFEKYHFPTQRPLQRGSEDPPAAGRFPNRHATNSTPE
jgi:hypothetical protein